jgi:hypothetical protein
MSGVYHELKQWFQLFLELAVVAWDKRIDFNYLSNDVPALIDYDIVSLAFLVA